MDTTCIHRYDEVIAFERSFNFPGTGKISVYFYLFDGILVDTGQSKIKNIFLSLVSGLKIEQAVLTHHHEDHSGNAALLKDDRGVPVYGHPLTVEKMRKGFNILPFQKLASGPCPPLELLPLPEKVTGNKHALIPIHTPGHSRDHTVFLERERGWLFSGDLYVTTRVKYFRSDDILLDEINSLEKILLYDFDTVFCGHRFIIQEGKKKMREKLDYFRGFYWNIQSLVDCGFSDREIIKKVNTSESYILKCITFNNVSAKNMIVSAISSIRQGHRI